MKEIKTIGVLTSGGDAPGMNASVRAVVRTGLYNDMKVFGIRKGYNGLIHGDMIEMDARSVANIIYRGGTILYTARCEEFKTLDGREKAVKMAKVFGIDGLVVIGGDGSFRGAREISKMGIPTIGIPGTIDNDIACSDYSIGFDTAVNTAVDAINKLRDTAVSHERCSIIEVMGRNSGQIAVNCGIAGGAEYVIIPEREYNQNEVIKSIIEAKNKNKTGFIIVLSEGIGGANELAKIIEKQTGVVTRATILGHVQRGGTPTAKDMIVASKMGVKAVELLKQGIGNRVVVMKDDKIIDYDIEEGLSMTKTIDEEEYKLTKILSI